MEKDSFKLDKNVAEALQSFAAFNQRPETPPAAAESPSLEEEPSPVAAEPAESVPAAAAPTVEALSGQDAVWDWYQAMKPGVMNKFDWLVMLSCQAARSGGVIVIDELAGKMRVRADKLARALNELALAGWITVLHTERGGRGRTISKTIRVNRTPAK
ncbi:hypothetical protein [Pyramidobacter piscolens]|uniref:Uncharacterized protein n=1 Tax=Pyramidobacter piscolens W5455 TaxID=352165 RepID=A0ABM9ZYF9_9BACT|nr:hypothetical protein [Pyramidobacter piscolens]EFB91879.1 hypothetical protein HMPREF7215_1354 [Pyramidobacter piscolens W5455]BDF77434.1 hypothetical protein CE91St28_02280 [Pyramidobacter piscolens]